MSKDPTSYMPFSLAKWLCKQILSLKRYQKFQKNKNNNFILPCKITAKVTSDVA